MGAVKMEMLDINEPLVSKEDARQAYLEACVGCSPHVQEYLLDLHNLLHTEVQEDWKRIVNQELDATDQRTIVLAAILPLVSNIVELGI
ncbi:MAG TPA: hypothetical protein VFN31_00645 [Candidatus Saccharimonadales bacterium]|nr:hypothetical protein [Candidatus Saccharimonadales bacterium]